MNQMPQMDEAQLAQLAGEFLKRVNLNGGEAPVFMQVQQWLMSKAQPAPAVPAPKKGSDNG